MTLEINSKKRLIDSILGKKNESIIQNSLYGVVAISVLIWFFFNAVVNIFNNNFSIAISSLVLSLIIGISFFYSKKSNKNGIIKWILVFVICAFVIISYLIGDFKNEFIQFSPLLPIVIFIVIDKSVPAIILNFFLLLALIFSYVYTDLEFCLQNQEYFIYFIVVSVFLYFYKLVFLRNFVKIEESESIIQQKEEEHKHFLRQLSYQLRIPLNNIVGMSDFFSGTELDDIQQDYLDTINASAFLLLGVVEQLENKKEKNPALTDSDNTRFNLYLTVNNFIDFAKVQYHLDNISVDFDEALPSRVIGNPIKIKQILFLLIDIFKSYTPDSDVNLHLNFVLEKIEEEKIYYKFTISKKGKIHITNINDLRQHAQEDLINILDLKPVKDLSKSINNGMYVDISENELVIILRGFFESGELKVDDEQEGINVNSKKGRLEQNIAFDINEVLRSTNILLVEDNVINQKVIMLALENLVANIDIANNGKEALDAIGKNKYDLILMDIQMPVMNGIKASEKIRELEKTSNTYTPIIAVTANALQGDKNYCLQAGMDDYLTKPINLEKLKKIMADLLQKYSQKR